MQPYSSCQTITAIQMKDSFAYRLLKSRVKSMLVIMYVLCYKAIRNGLFTC
jgi:hypothetical protein